MYANLLGSRVAKTTVTSEVFKHGAGTVPAVDAVVTCDSSRKHWKAALVNRHPTAPARCVIQFDGTPISGKWPATVLSGDSTEAFNDIEHPDRVTPRNLELELENGAVQLPPHSVTILEINRNPLPERLILNGGFESGVAQDRPEAWEPTRWGEGDYRASCMVYFSTIEL